jgi:hypothetical protein
VLLAWSLAAVSSFVARRAPRDEASGSDVGAQSAPVSSQASAAPIPPLIPVPIPAPIPALRTGVDGEEFFALELRSPPGPGGKPVAARPVGVACLRRGFDEVVQLELEARFFEERTRLHCIETRGPRGVELVWREWRAGDGRTLHARHVGERVELVDWGRLEALRSNFQAPAGLVWPLEAIERARTRGGLEAWSSTPMLRFDPAGRRVEELRVRWDEAAPADSGEARAANGCARWFGVDGAQAGEFTFVDGALREFRWQGGELVARSVDAEEFARRIREHEDSLVER